MRSIIITIPAKKIAFLLVGLAIYLCVQSLLIGIIDHELEPELTDWYRAVRRLSNVNAENNIPTWYSSGLLLTSGLVAALIALIQMTHKDGFRWHWVGLALVFALLSMDETASIHETLTRPIRVTLDTSGYLRFAWIVAGVPLVILFLAVYARFIQHLPLQIRNLFVLAITFYVGGIIVIEAISSQRKSADGGFSSLTYTATATVEEFFEMMGAILFLYTLLSYLETICEKLHIKFTGTPEPVDVLSERSELTNESNTS